jgi:hypothetical protein
MEFNISKCLIPHRVTAWAVKNRKHCMRHSFVQPFNNVLEEKGLSSKLIYCFCTSTLALKHGFFRKHLRFFACLMAMISTVQANHVYG